MAVAFSAFESGVLSRIMSTASTASTDASPWVYELMDTKSARDVALGAYGSAIIETRRIDEGRQRNASPYNLETEVGLRLLWRLRADNQVGDYQAAHLIMASVRQTVIDGADGNDSNGAQAWNWIRNLQARVVGEGTHVLLESRYRCRHLLNTF